jgi:hypothetical protein
MKIATDWICDILPNSWVECHKMAGTPHSSMTGRLAHHTALWLDDWHTTQLYDWRIGTPHRFITGWLAHPTALWLNNWHTTQLCDWTGTTHNFMTEQLSHHTALWLDDWHTTQLYNWTTGIPHSSVTGQLAHHTALWLEDWHTTQIYNWMSGTPHSSITGWPTRYTSFFWLYDSCAMQFSVSTPEVTHLLPCMTDTLSVSLNGRRSPIRLTSLLTDTVTFYCLTYRTVIFWHRITDLLLNRHYSVTSLIQGTFYELVTNSSY